MKSWFNIFIYISLAFLIFYLYQNNFLIIPRVNSASLLLLSIMLLSAGFLLNVKAWQALLKSNDSEVSYSKAVTSIGLSIFGKYIPGKIWILFGRALYIADKEGDSILKITTISFLGQAISIITGVLMGSVVLWYYMNNWFLIIFFINIGILLIIISPFTKLLSEKIYFLPKGQQAIQLLGPHLIKALPWFIFFWACWGLGFYSMVGSLTYVTTWTVAPMFILSGTAGILVFFVPGGIGVREGALYFFLLKSGYSVEMATTIAVGSRLWFLVGEIFIFCCGFLASIQKGIK